MCSDTRIRVGHAPFQVGEEYQWLAQGEQAGAVVTFTGKVRDNNLGVKVRGLTLEHYPGMTEKTLDDIVRQARERWQVQRISLIHRVGRLSLGEEIVFVGVSSGHRNMAFAAATFMMDFIKTQAPFWKHEVTEQGENWVEARYSDKQALQRWL